jgi:RNA polymerase primary sigma factor/RNA polymerase sigma factor
VWTVDEAKLMSRLQAGYCCRERLVVTTEWLVRYIARTYIGMGTALDDLLQVHILHFIFIGHH